MGSPVSKRKTRRTSASRKKAGAKKSAQGLLVEILTEELPPKSLKYLSEVFAERILNGLSRAQLKQRVSGFRAFATPRRLAVFIPNVLWKAQDRTEPKELMPTKVAFDEHGKPSMALLKRLEKEGRSARVGERDIERRTNGETEYVYVNVRIPGATLPAALDEVLKDAIKKLPVAKLMRWGDNDVQFVRPVHGLIMLHSKKVVPGTVLGLKSGRTTLGHRFLSRGKISIADADQYEKTLEKAGKVIPRFDKRKTLIKKGLEAKAKAAKSRVMADDALLDEVTSLVEFPKVYEGKFSEEFLSMPVECLIVSMKQHQRYFPLYDSKGKLLPLFLFVSNVETKTPKYIIQGNERVLRARLSDAKFFFEQDKKIKLADRVPKLSGVVYHNKLGSQLARVERIQGLAAEIARLVHADVAAAERAAYLCKADLVTDMVGEFPELQGIMGGYYANHDGEDPHVADAIRQHYRPRYAGDDLPLSATDISVALADKLDTLVGIYGIGLIPTGDKDPFGLRRQALGVIRILIERTEMLPSLDVVKLLQRARNLFPNGVVADSVAQDLHAFMLERLKPYLRDHGYQPDEIDAVLSLNPTRMDQVLLRMQALQEFRRLPEAEALAAANKRIRNILRQAGNIASSQFDAGLFKEEAEKRLAAQIQTLDTQIAPMLNAGNYKQALQHLASLRSPVDEFFDQVMVMVDDEAIRNNRLALLHNLSNLFLRVADISRLQPQNQVAV